MERFFKLKERNTTVKTEFIAGMTTFFAMVYILMVNANMFANPFGDGSNPLGVSYGAIYIATAISAIVGTILAGLMANLPLAQASGMGLNAFFVYTVCVGFGLSYANAGDALYVPCNCDHEPSQYPRIRSDRHPWRYGALLPARTYG